MPQIKEGHRFVEHRLPRKLAAILYADVAGYSRLTGHDEDGTQRTLRSYLTLLSSRIREHAGRVVHYAGDAVLADFGTVIDAVSCAVAVQQELAERNESVPKARKVQFRVGVNLGDVIVDGSEIYGDGVNVAARLESLAEPGGICVSDAVRAAVGNKPGLHFEDMGVQRVKKISQPLRSYRVRLLADDALASAVASNASSSFPASDIHVPSLAVMPFQFIGSAGGQDMSRPRSPGVSAQRSRITC